MQPSNSPNPASPNPASPNPASPASNPYVASVNVTASAPGNRTRRLCVKRIEPVSAAKISGILYAIFTLPTVVIMFFVSLLGAGIGGNAAGAQGAIPGIVGALFALVILPVVAGVAGFVGGLIGALIFNLASSLVGGIEMDVEV
ncbi:hypothetical protein [Stieleria varia]|uniref:DUF3566 domain-containing protein n=1 Tax=Stieleria varia TaxID=2528005 RepID=A0A5C5ZQ76_9BACT|nr:hypothetical protein [Stieleria varia]TWT89346.1 hypothetical protein Pla52n_68480 [Stieleria varia]